MSRAESSRSFPLLASERFFAEVVDLGGVAQAGPDQLGALCQRFALEMDPGSVPGLVERFNLRFPAEQLIAR